MTEPQSDLSLSEEMVKYQDNVHLLAEAASDQVFPCRGDDQTAIVKAAIMGVSSHVRVYAHNFDGTVGGKDTYVKALQAFILRGGKLDLILDEEPQDKTRSAYKDLKEYQARNWEVQIVIADDDFKSEIQEVYDKYIKTKPLNIDLDKYETRDQNQKRYCHFSIGSGNNTSYRIEDYCEERISFVCFNDDANRVSLPLKKSFDKHLKRIATHSTVKR